MTGCQADGFARRNVEWEPMHSTESFALQLSCHFLFSPVVVVLEGCDRVRSLRAGSQSVSKATRGPLAAGSRRNLVASQKSSATTLIARRQRGRKFVQWVVRRRQVRDEIGPAVGFSCGAAFGGTQTLTSRRHLLHAYHIAIRARRRGRAVRCRVHVDHRERPAAAAAAVGAASVRRRVRSNGLPRQHAQDRRPPAFRAPTTSTVMSRPSGRPRIRRARKRLS